MRRGARTLAAAAALVCASAAAGCALQDAAPSGATTPLEAPAPRPTPEQTLFTSARPVDAPSAEAAFAALVDWCRDHYRGAVGLPSFSRAGFVNRADGFGLWPLTVRDHVAGATELGACEGYAPPAVVAMTPEGGAALLRAAKARFGVVADAETVKTEGEWPAIVLAGRSIEIGAPVIMRLMMEREPREDGSPGGVKLSIGLWDEEAGEDG